MRAIAALLCILYLAPPVGLLLYGVEKGSVGNLWDAMVVSLRGFVVAITALAVGIGMSEKLRFLQKDGAQFYARFYIFYILLFFIFSFFLGLDIQFPDQHRTGRYTY